MHGEAHSHSGLYIYEIIYSRAFSSALVAKIQQCGFRVLGEVI